MAWTLFGSNWLTGIICMWHGLLVDIPNGWALCDGTQGTPDLRERFVRGAPDGIDPGGTGGTTQHQHSVSGTTGVEDTAHEHEVSGLTDWPEADSDDVNDIIGEVMEYDIHLHGIDLLSGEETYEHRHTFFNWSSNTSTLPVYYDIAFIMKL